ALIADKQGMADIETIITQGKDWLKPNGWIVLEHGYDQGQLVREIFEQLGFDRIQTIKDYGGNDRVSLGQKQA
ncbi:MAG: peptide chain release factor N(5)-glutamine methyltransferase, partial [Acinetobacter sp.]